MQTDKLSIENNQTSLIQSWKILSSKVIENPTVINTVGLMTVDKDDNNKLNIYTGTLTEEKIKVELIRIMLHFPKLDKNFYELLKMRLKTRPDFTDQKLEDAVTYLIDSCKYQEPTLAWILDYKNQIDVFEQWEIVEKASREGQSVWNDYGMIKVEGRKSIVFTLKTNIEKYKLTEVKPGNPEPKIHYYRRRTDGDLSINKTLSNIHNLEDLRKVI